MAFSFLREIMKLEEWREEIDAIDEKIMNLINQRVKIARKIGSLKTKASMPIVDVKREKQILQKVCSKNNGILNNDSIVSIYRKIIQESRLVQIQAMKNICDEEVKVC